MKSTLDKIENERPVSVILWFGVLLLIIISLISLINNKNLNHQTYNDLYDDYIRATICSGYYLISFFSIVLFFIYNRKTKLFWLQLFLQFIPFVLITIIFIKWIDPNDRDGWTFPLIVFVFSNTTLYTFFINYLIAHNVLSNTKNLINYCTFSMTNTNKHNIKYLSRVNKYNNVFYHPHKMKFVHNIKRRAGSTSVVIWITVLFVMFNVIMTYPMCEPCLDFYDCPPCISNSQYLACFIITFFFTILDIYYYNKIKIYNIYIIIHILISGYLLYYFNNINKTFILNWTSFIIAVVLTLIVTYSFWINILSSHDIIRDTTKLLKSLSNNMFSVFCRTYKKNKVFV